MTTAAGPIRERSSGRASLIANAIGRIWMLAANIVMFPVYLRLLGPEHFGVVALLAAITAIVALFDFGLTPVFARELNHQGRTAQSRLDLLHTAERVYLAIVVALAIIVALAPATWFSALVNESASASPAIASSMRWVFAVAAVQLLLNFYVSALSGIERQVQSNAVNVGTGVLRSVGVVLPLLMVPQVDVFLWWQFGATLTGALLARHLLQIVLRGVAGGARAHFSGADLRASLPVARASFLLATAATLNMNLDRLFVGRLEGLARIGEYTVVATFAQLIFIASVPITMTVTPRMVRAVTGNDLHAFEDLLTTTRTAVGLVTAVLLIVFLRHGPVLIEHWSAGAVRASQTRGYAGWLFLGAASVAASAIWHCVATAHQDFSFGRVYVYSVLLVAPLYGFAVHAHGVAGAAVAWGCTQVLIMLAYRAWVDRRLLRGRAMQATPWAGLSTGALATLAAGALLVPWTGGPHSFPGALAAVAAEIALASLFAFVALVLLVRRLDNKDGLAARADAWIRAIRRRPSAP
jgi:O-antigen/teichoic acid export membrane protein